MFTLLSSLSKVFSTVWPEPSISATISTEIHGFYFCIFFSLKATGGTCADAVFTAVVSSSLTDP